LLGGLRSDERLGAWHENHTRQQNAESARRDGDPNTQKSVQSASHSHEFLKRRNGFSRYRPTPSTPSGRINKPLDAGVTHGFVFDS
jgi:hypothetical protein